MNFLKRLAMLLIRVTFLGWQKNINEMEFAWLLGKRNVQMLNNFTTKLLKI